nr:hypothetical protein [uncultured Massilia sp.]
MMNTITKLATRCVAVAAIWSAFPAAIAAAPEALALPLDGQAFTAHSLAFSPDGSRVCVAGVDTDDMGVSVTRLLLADRTGRKLVWEKTVPVPDGLAGLDPVQCVVGADRVYLLANAATSSSPPQSQSRAYVYVFDLRGTALASRQVDVPGQSRYGYAMGESPSGLKLVGYTRDQDGDTERYATYTVTLDGRLAPVGAPLLRKNGAYTPPLGARIVGDSVYLAGRFFPATVARTATSEYMASRLRTDGGYTWSVRTPAVKRTSVNIAVADDGTSYLLGYSGETTSLVAVAADGKAAAPLTYASEYCEPAAVARQGTSVVAVRERCKGSGSVLVSIDPVAGREHVVKPVPGEPMYFTATGAGLWAILARDAKGRVFLYSGSGGAF